jgi:hypothetical protein
MIPQLSVVDNVEHGVGLEKLGAMCSQFSDDEREVFLGIKARTLMQIIVTIKGLAVVTYDRNVAFIFSSFL